MNNGKICISVCARTADEMLARVTEAIPLADLIELRLDCLPPAEVDKALTELPKTEKSYLITYRPTDQGGHADANKINRMKFWSYALWKLREHDFIVDYEGDIDFPLKLNPERTIVSLHCFGGVVPDLALTFDVLVELTGKTIKIAVATIDVTDAIPVWKLLDHAAQNGRRIIPIGMNEPGKWTRILGLAHGAAITYGSTDDETKTAPGQITVADLRDVFRVKELDRETHVFGVVAGDTSYSMSPYMHNAAFKAAGMNSVFVPFQTTDLDAFIRRMIKRDSREVELNVRGLSVTNPHKQAIIPLLDEIDPTAKAIGAVNTVKIDGDKIVGLNTDAAGFIAPLREKFGDLAGARAAVVGAGGAARACVYALKQAGAEVTLLARHVTKAKTIGDEFSITVSQLPTDNSPLETDILVNATPLGTRGPHETESVATAEELRDVKLVYDLVYNPRETRLLREAKSAGVQTLGGLDMLVAQGVEQFKIWTGTDAPIAAMGQALEQRLQ